MIRSRFARVVAVAWGLLALEAPAQEAARPGPVSFRIKAGGHDRRQTPIRFELPEDRFGPGDRKALDRGPVPFMVWGEPVKARDGESGPAGPAGTPAQAERIGEGSRVRVTFILQGPIPKGAEEHFQLQVGTYPKLGSEFRPPWSFHRSVPGALVLKHREGIGQEQRDREVFRYNAAPVSSPELWANPDPRRLHPPGVSLRPER